MGGRTAVLLVGSVVGLSVGRVVGSAVGRSVGRLVGAALGAGVGADVGLSHGQVGAGVGAVGPVCADVALAVKDMPATVTTGLVVSSWVVTAVYAMSRPQHTNATPYGTPCRKTRNGSAGVGLEHHGGG